MVEGSDHAVVGSRPHAGVQAVIGRHVHHAPGIRPVGIRKDRPGHQKGASMTASARRLLAHILFSSGELCPKVGDGLK